MSDEVRTCVGCKHGQVPIWMYGQPKPQEAECKHPEAVTRELVYGKAMCNQERNVQGSKGCGPKGRLWEAKPA